MHSLCLLWNLARYQSAAVAGLRQRSSGQTDKALPITLPVSCTQNVQKMQVQSTQKDLFLTEPSVTVLRKD